MSKLGEALEVWIQFITATVAMDNAMQKVWDEAASRGYDAARLDRRVNPQWQDLG